MEFLDKKTMPLRFFLLALFFLQSVSVAHSDGFGTGFFYNSRGDIMTNRHVVENCTEIIAELPNKSVVSLTVLALSEKHDLAALSSGVETDRFLALRVDENKFPLIPVEDEEVFTVGYSDFDTKEEIHGVAGFIISREDDRKNYELMVRIDAEPGSSGSAVIGRDLLLIGVISSGVQFQETGEDQKNYYGDNIVFAQSGNAIADFVNETGIYISTWQPDRWFKPMTAWDHLQAVTSLVFCVE